ncbi:glycosyltransferase [Butyrivibrio sp. WCE2006]|uniref:glycosyltransferase n=1 Tax=Butyrivibrio sp. WCE2006 TaxID=1410611 RepID=UPI0005D2199E|nr:glycosyltransferase [Butyrivibrio sp. WCE2006]
MFNKIKKGFLFIGNSAARGADRFRIREHFKGIQDFSGMSVSVVYLPNDNPGVRKRFEESIKKSKTNIKYEIVENAADARGEYLVFVNNVDEVHDGWLDFLAEAFVRNDNVGIVGGSTYYSMKMRKGKALKIRFKGVKYLPYSTANRGTLCKLLDADVKTEEENFGIAGTDIPSINIIMIKADYYKKIGGLCSLYVNNSWDFALADLCLMSKAYGKDNYLADYCLVSVFRDKEIRKANNYGRPILPGRWRSGGNQGTRPKPDNNEIDICASMPGNDDGKFWGDYHFAYALKGALEKLGYKVNVLPIDDWYKESTARTVIVLRGKHGYYRKALSDGQRLVYWTISHPADIRETELMQADYIFYASDIMKKKFGEKVAVPSEILMQCTDPSVMSYSKDKVIPENNYAPELLFVGNSRGVFRKILRDVLPTDHDLHVYGRHWDKFPEVQSHVIANYIPNDKVSAVYHDARILLNDHWDDMREYGIISNRIFDAMCAGAFVISDDVPGLNETFGSSLVTYKDRKDLSDKIDYYLTHEYERDRIARAGKKMVLENHTFDSRAKRISEVIEADKQARL